MVCRGWGRPSLLAFPLCSSSSIPLSPRVTRYSMSFHAPLKRCSPKGVFWNKNRQRSSCKTLKGTILNIVIIFWEQESLAHSQPGYECLASILCQEWLWWGKVQSRRRTGTPLITKLWWPAISKMRDLHKDNWLHLSQSLKCIIILLYY